MKVSKSLPPILAIFCLITTALRAQTLPTPATPATGPAPLPTTAEIQSQIDSAQYRDALKNILRVLDLKGPAAAPYDRPAIFLLRAECQLQLRLLPAAQDALDAAVRESRGSGGSAPNPDAAAKAWALSALIAKSTNLNYTPKVHTGPVTPKPISLLDRTARTAACKALFDDSLAGVKTQISAAQAATSMPPVLEAAKSVATLRALELLGTGDTPESAPLVQAMVTRATTLLHVSLGNMHNTVDTIAQGANQTYTTPMLQSDPVTGTRAMVQVSHRRGLVNEDAARLRSIEQTANQIIPACLDLNLALNSPDTFHQIATDADTLAQKAAQTLSDDYSRTP